MNKFYDYKFLRNPKFILLFIIKIASSFALETMDVVRDVIVIARNRAVKTSLEAVISAVITVIIIGS